MVHGNPTWSFYYRRLVEALARVVPDDRPRPHRLRAARTSRATTAYEYTLESRVDDLEALLDHLGARRRPDAGRPRLGRDDRHGLRRAAPRADRAAGDPEHGGVPPAGVEAVPLAALGLPRHAARGLAGPRAERLLPGRPPRIGCKHQPMPRDVRDAYLAPYDSWANRIAIHRFVQDIPLRPGDRVVRPGHRARRTGCTGFADVADADRLGDEGLRLRPPLPRRVGPPLPRRPRSTGSPSAGHYVLEDEAEQVVPLVRVVPGGASGAVEGRRYERATGDGRQHRLGPDRDGPGPAVRDGRRLPRRARPRGAAGVRPLDVPAARPRERRRWRAGSTRVGIGRGVRTVLMVKPSLEFFALTFALFKAGAVPVLIDPGMGVKNLGRCLAEAEPEAFIGIPRPQLARRLLGWGQAIDPRRPSPSAAAPSLGRGAHARRRPSRGAPSVRTRAIPTRSPARGPRRPPRSSSPAGARGRPRGRSTPTRSSTRRWRSSATSTGSSRARSTSARSRCSPCSPPRWG